MDHEFKDKVWKMGFFPSISAETREDRLRSLLGLVHKYDSARLSIGMSLADVEKLDFAAYSGLEKGKAIAGEFLFGDDIDLWMSIIAIDAGLGESASPDDFRRVVEAHWNRGAALLSEELEVCGDDKAKFISRLADLLPATNNSSGAIVGSSRGEIVLKVGSVSKTFPEGDEVTFSINAPGVAPHIALMGKNGSGKTTTGVQIANQIAIDAGIPILFIDPKGEFVSNESPIGALKNIPGIRAIEVGEKPIPLDFLPDPSIGAASIAQCAMQFRDSLALCGGKPGDIQLDLLRNAVERVIRGPRPRDLNAVKNAYRNELQSNSKNHDSIMSRLNELTSLRIFSAEMNPRDFFTRSWVLSLKNVGSEDLKKLIILLVLDSLRTVVLSQQDSPVEGGFRSLRHLLVIDEARRILANKKYQSLVDLVRQGRSKGEVVMLLSQDPSDFDGQADDFTTQLGTIIAFACAQSDRGLRSLQGAYGRKLQSSEFSDVTLPTGVAFTKLPGNRPPQMIRCWSSDGI